MAPRRDHGQCPAEALLQLRRLASFLKLHGLRHTADTLEMEAGLFFDPARLQKLVKEGRWTAAHRYLRSFSALWDDDGAAARYYAALLGDLAHNSTVAWFACRGEEGGRAAALRIPYSDDCRKAYPELFRHNAIYCSMTSQQARESVNWKEIKLATLESVRELLLLRPGLERVPSNRLPRDVPTPRDMIPLGLRGCRRHRRKRISHKPARDLAHFLVNKRLPSSHRINHSGESGRSSEAENSLMLNQGHPPEWSSKGVKRPGFEDETQDGQQNFDSGKDRKKLPTDGEFDEEGISKKHGYGLIKRRTGFLNKASGSKRRSVGSSKQQQSKEKISAEQ